MKWTIDENPENSIYNDWYNINSTKPNPIATVRNIEDAKLIASAPELLKACKFTIAGLSINSPSYNKLKQAINKAERGVK
jgi:hypothetical protein